MYSLKRNVLGTLGALLIVASLTNLFGCSAPGRFLIPETKGIAEQLPPDSLKTFRIYFVGDAGYLSPGKDNLLLLDLERRLQSEDSASAVVFLGDNVYDSGMPPVTDPTRPEAERRANAQINAVKDFKGKVILIPGNHDWGGGGMGGSRATLRRQEVYFERALTGKGNVFLPDNGFPGPSEVDLSDDILLVALDTQWWLEDIKTYGDTGQYELESEGEFLLELHNILQRNAEKSLIVVGHHPLFSNGSHGGRFVLSRWLLSPLVTFSRRYLGTPQDISNLKYRRLRQGMQDIFELHRNLVYAAGHEHNLQYFLHDQQHYIVSGSGSKIDDVIPGFGAAFTDQKYGYSRITYYSDGSQWLEYLALNKDSSATERAYLTRIQSGEDRKIPQNEIIAETDTLAPPAFEVGTDGGKVVAEGTDGHAGTNGSTVVGAPVAPYSFSARGTVLTRAGDYGAGGLAGLLLGKRYRRIWDLPVEAPIIDLRRTAGGLTPDYLGGGFQTLSLRLTGADGDSYVLRSINKDPTRSIPPFLRRTIAQDVIRDQVSAVHPYAALPLPRMADAIGVYHTAPRLVSIPDDPRLGRYQEVFSGLLAQFEYRPDEEQTDEPLYDRPDNIVGSPKLFEDLAADNDRRVDQRAWARARLFDMFIGDWDRHADQWRWAEFDEGPGRTYKPIGRDHDFAFFRFNGLLAQLAGLSGVQAFSRFTNFRKEYGDLYGLNYNGLPLDRRFTSKLSEQDWIEIADSIKMNLTDTVIREALQDWPASVYQVQGDEFFDILTTRRDQLASVASQYYHILTETVDVVGSDKHERFEVTRINNDSTRVVVYKTQKEGNITGELYRRVFNHDETHEIRLYGLDGNDQFIVRGDAGRGIRIRAIGGGDDDTYTDSSHVTGASHKSIFYDTVEGNTWNVNRETIVNRSDDPANNEYQMLRPERDFFLPTLNYGYNADDGLLIGGGLQFTKQGFRKSPYAARHQFRARYGTLSQRIDASYSGLLIERYKGRDIGWNTMFRSERAFDNFYGLGNATPRSARAQYHASLGNVIVQGYMRQDLFPFTTLRYGPRFEYTDANPRGDLTQSGFSTRDLRDTYFAGAEANLDVVGTDTLAATQSGVRWLNSLSFNVGVRNTSAVFARLASELSYFYTADLPIRTTFAFRIGGARNIGDFFFYQANTLGGQENLRGYPRTRFAGRASLYTNFDIRARLFSFNAYITRGEGGLLLFTDNGRVWQPRTESGNWHHSAGGGVWLSPFYQTVITGTVGASAEETLFELRLGFLF